MLVEVGVCDDILHCFVGYPKDPKQLKTGEVVASLVQLWYTADNLWIGVIPVRLNNQSLTATAEIVPVIVTPIATVSMRAIVYTCRLVAYDALTWALFIGVLFSSSLILQVISNWLMKRAAAVIPMYQATAMPQMF